LTFEVLVYGDAALRQTAKPVEKVDDNIRRLARDMLSTMYASNGVGLAAEQVGRTEAVCVIDVSPVRPGAQEAPDQAEVPMPLILINPKITDAAGEQLGDEGCLSFPDVFVPVKRAAEIAVRYLDIENRPQALRAQGLLARAIQHEIDHLEGLLLVDRMSPVQRIAVAGKLKRLKKQARRKAPAY
jgi:peptide deformylase